MMVLTVTSFNAAPSGPSGWQSLGTCSNPSPDYISAWAARATGSASYSVSGNYPKAIMRVYHGPVNVDAAACSGNLTIPALAPTTASNDFYIAFFVNDASSVTPPGDLGHGTQDPTQWQSWDGDKVIASSGTTPGPETATASGGNSMSFGITLTTNSSTPTPTPTPTGGPTPTPTPTPIPGQHPVDTNATQTTKDMWNFLSNLSHAGSTQHMLPSAFRMVRNCYDVNGNVQSCDSLEQQEVSAVGDIPGSEGVDSCNAFWGDPNSSPCLFGDSSNSSATYEAEKAWHRHQVVMFDLDFPNPYDNWQVLPAASYGKGGVGSGTPCGPIPQVPYGVMYDCTGITQAFLASMLTPGTTDNAHWNSELDQFASDFKKLQDQGISVVVKMLHEYNGGTMWYGVAAYSGQFPQLYNYIVHYMNDPDKKNLHNLLWSLTSLEQSPNAPSGINPDSIPVDLGGADIYNRSLFGGKATGYDGWAAYGLPYIIPEFNCSSSSDACIPGTNFDSIAQAGQYNMPLLVMPEYWQGPSPALKYPGTIGGNTWSQLIKDSYSCDATCVNNKWPHG
jgi:hypothetical protein